MSNLINLVYRMQNQYQRVNHRVPARMHSQHSPRDMFAIGGGFQWACLILLFHSVKFKHFTFHPAVINRPVCVSMSSVLPFGSIVCTNKPTESTMIFVSLCKTYSNTFKTFFQNQQYFKTHFLIPNLKFTNLKTLKTFFMVFIEKNCMKV